MMYGSKVMKISVFGIFADINSKWPPKTTRGPYFFRATSKNHKQTPKGSQKNTFQNGFLRVHGNPSLLLDYNQRSRLRSLAVT